MPKNKNAMIRYLYLDKLFQRQGYSIDEILDKLNDYLYDYDNSSVSRRVSSGRSSQLRVRSEALCEERDSVVVSAPRLANEPDKGSGLRATLKWIFAILCAMTGLIITVRVCWRRAS